MKNNRKNRSLEFIREKNYLRKGHHICNISHFSEEMLSEQDYIDSMERRLVDDTIAEFNKRYRVGYNYETVSCEIGMDSESFRDKLCIMKATIKRKF